MPRNASGEYSLPAGNPVAIDTIISPTWANPTMDDIGNEITNSLDRNGRGGMLVPFQNADGTKSSPGITFTSQTGIGLYRQGTNDIRMSIAAEDATRWVDETGETPGEWEPLEVWNGLAWVKVLSSSSAPVTSVNGQSGVVVLDTDDIADTAANRYASDTLIADWNTAFGWGNWATGVDKAFVDALNIDASTLGGLGSTSYGRIASTNNWTGINDFKNNYTSFGQDNNHFFTIDVDKPDTTAVALTTDQSRRIVLGGKSDKNSASLAYTSAIFGNTSSSINYSSALRFSTTSTGATITGDLAVTGEITGLSSDRRLKENITRLEGSLSKLKALAGVNFDWASQVQTLGFKPRNLQNDLGLIAQDVQKVCPQAVSIAPFDSDDTGKNISGEEYLTVQYEKLIPLLIEGIKELDNRLAVLEE